MKEYRKTTRGDKADIAKINDCIKAAIELKEASGRFVYNSNVGFSPSKRKVGEARRRGLAQNAMEDAFFLDTDFGLGGNIIAGGAAEDALPDETIREIASPSSLVDIANRFGGNLEAAGEALFDDDLIKLLDAPGAGLDDASLPSDTGVFHATVASQVLTQSLF